MNLFHIVFLAFFGVLFVFFAIGGAMSVGRALYGCWRYYGLLSEARQAGLSTSMGDVLNMYLQKVDPSVVVGSMITAQQEGITLKRQDLAVAYLLGLDVTKLTSAAIEADKRGLEVSFEELMETELEEPSAGATNR